MKKPAVKKPSKWNSTTLRQCAREAINWTDVESIVFKVDPELTHPAEYRVDLHEVTVNPNMTGESTKAMRGFLAHEIGHSVFSKPWRRQLAPLGGGVRVDGPTFQTMQVLDEIRIERRVYDKGNGADLRESFSQWLKMQADSPISPDPYSIGTLWALCHGRYLAGIADAEDIAPMDRVAETVLGKDVVEELADILGAATVTDSAHALKYHAEEWNEIIRALMPEDESLDGKGNGCCSSSEKGEEEGEGEGKGEGEDGGDQDGDPTDGPTGHGDSLDGDFATSELPQGAAEDIDTGAAAPDLRGEDRPFVKEMQEVLTKAMEEVSESFHKRPLPEKSDLANAREYAKRVFSTKRDTSVWLSKPVPADVARRAAIFTRELEEIALPGIVKTKMSMAAPPGRLRGREALRRDAERAQGLLSKAEPWRHTKRKHMHTKPVVVGVMTDVSGSMGYAEQIVANFTYTIGLAGVHIGARTAAVTFGSRVLGTLKPGETPHEIRVVSACDGHEQFDKGLAALDGVLNLSYRNNDAKILFVFSDAELVIDGETNRALTRLRQLAMAGTTIVWVGMGAHRAEMYQKQVPGIILMEKISRGSYSHTMNEDLLFKQMAEAIKAKMRSGGQR